jgi:hypothetical protein
MCLGRGRVPPAEIRWPIHVAISLDRLELLNTTITLTTLIVVAAGQADAPRDQ